MHFRSRLNENQGTSKACNNVSRQASCIAKQRSHLNVACTALLKIIRQHLTSRAERYPGNIYADLA